MYTVYASSTLIGHDRYCRSPFVRDVSHGSAAPVVDARSSPPTWQLAHGTMPWMANQNPSRLTARDNSSR